MSVFHIINSRNITPTWGVVRLHLNNSTGSFTLTPRHGFWYIRHQNTTQWRYTLQSQEVSVTELLHLWNKHFNVLKNEEWQQALENYKKHKCTPYSIINIVIIHSVHDLINCLIISNQMCTLVLHTCCLQHTE